MTAALSRLLYWTGMLASKYLTKDTKPITGFLWALAMKRTLKSNLEDKRSLGVEC